MLMNLKIPEKYIGHGVWVEYPKGSFIATKLQIWYVDVRFGIDGWIINNVITSHGNYDPDECFETKRQCNLYLMHRVERSIRMHDDAIKRQKECVRINEIGADIETKRLCRSKSMIEKGLAKFEKFHLNFSSKNS